MTTNTLLSKDAVQFLCRHIAGPDSEAMVAFQCVPEGWIVIMRLAPDQPRFDVPLPHMWPAMTWDQMQDHLRLHIPQQHTAPAVQ